MISLSLECHFKDGARMQRRSKARSERIFNQDKSELRKTFRLVLPRTILRSPLKSIIFLFFFCASQFKNYLLTYPFSLQIVQAVRSISFLKNYLLKFACSQFGHFTIFSSLSRYNFVIKKLTLQSAPCRTGKSFGFFFNERPLRGKLAVCLFSKFSS